MRLIDADALYREYQSVVCHDISCAECKAVDKDTGECRVDYLISDAPTIDSDRPKGKWIDNGDRYFRCSLCGTKDTDTWDWCHGCGCRMKGADDE